MTDGDLKRIAADLDHARAAAVLAPRRRESLRAAASILRCMASGELSRALADKIIAAGGSPPPPKADR